MARNFLRFLKKGIQERDNPNSIRLTYTRL